MLDVPKFIPQGHIGSVVSYIYETGLCPYCYGRHDKFKEEIPQHIYHCVNKLESEIDKTNRD